VINAFQGEKYEKGLNFFKKRVISELGYIRYIMRHKLFIIKEIQKH